ncbi:helix-turn-helix domain-containing protein [Polaribacter tangerinus]|uniref:helix-turn-helix domain-containing protein n=1 Tax=Polaribacter tangerinus TaxID=1920034 RepID=UPI0011808B71|nr:helix-turn-helix domain-containing protein [Polaribacter tangerinus]
MSLNNAQSWIFSRNFFTSFSFSDYLHFPWHFLIAPLYYSFFIYYIDIKKKSINLLKVFVPLFIIMILIRIVFVYFYRNQISGDHTELFIKYNSIEEIFSLLVSLGVYGYSFHILSKKEKLFTKILAFDNLKWIYTFFKIGLLTYIVWIVALSITITLDFKEIVYTYFPLRVLTTILIYWLGYQAIVQLRLLKERKKLRKQLNFSTISKTEKDFENEKDAHKKILFDNIEITLQEKKLFTAPKLNAEFLATELDISVHKLSSTIKLFSEKNFNDYINDFRISLAKELLIHKDYKNYTITSIGLESGFNSKSTFYATFKKHTGFTPSQYQKKFLTLEE